MRSGLSVCGLIFLCGRLNHCKNKYVFRDIFLDICRDVKSICVFDGFQAVTLPATSDLPACCKASSSTLHSALKTLTRSKTRTQLIWCCTRGTHSTGVRNTISTCCDVLEPISPFSQLKEHFNLLEDIQCEHTNIYGCHSTALWKPVMSELCLSSRNRFLSVRDMVRILGCI